MPQVGVVTVASGIVFDGNSEVLSLRDLDVRSPRGTVSGGASLSLANGPSSATLMAKAEGIALSTNLDWTGFDVINAIGNATITAAREDVRGSAALALAPSAITVSTRNLSAFNAQVRGGARLDRRSHAISGRILADYPVLNGTVSVTADLAGSATNPRASLTAQSDNLSLGPAADVRLRATADANRDRMHLSSAVMDWQGHAVEASGNLLLQDGPPRLEIAARGADLSLAALLEGLGQPLPMDGTLTLAARITGPVADPVVELDLGAENLIAYGEKFGEFAASATYRSSFLEVGRLHLSKPQAAGIGELDGNAQADLKERTFSAEATAINLELESMKLPGGQPVRGALEFRFSAAGSFDDPEALIHAGLDSPNLGGVRADIALRNQVVTFEAESPRLTLDTPDVQGSAGFKASGQAPWGQWENVAASITIPTLDVVAAQHRIVNRAPIRLALRDRSVVVEELAVESEGATLSVEGGIAFAGPSGSRAVSQALTVDGSIPLDLAERYLPPDFPADLNGIVTLTGTVGGTVSAPIPDLTASTAGATVSSPQLRWPIEAIDTRVRFAGNRLTLESLDARLTGGTLHAEGDFGLDRRSGSARLTVDKINVAPLFFDAPQFQAPVSFTVDAPVLSPDLDAIRAAIRFSQIDVAGKSGTIRQTEETTLRLEQGRLSLDKFSIKGPSTGLAAAGTLQVTGAQELNLRVDGQVDADIFTRNSADYGLAGPIEAHVAVTGLIGQPLVNGNLNWRNGQFYSNNPVFAGDQLSLRAAFQGTKVVLEDLSGNVNGGRLSAKGSFAVRDGRPVDVDLALTGRSIFLDYPQGLQTASTSNLTLKSSGRDLLLAGRVNILDGSYRETLDLTRFMRSRQGEVSLIDNPNPILDSLRFNIEVQTRQPLVFDNNLGRFNTYTDLRLVGTPRRPGLTGRLELEEDGRIYFSGRTFNLSTAIIDFAEETRIAPRFNISADTRIGEYDVTLKLTGDIDNPQTAFSADPAANEDQIMSLLFTGSVNNAGRGAAYAQTQLLTLFGSSLTGGISNRLRNTFGVSEFRIDPGLISPDADPTARLTIGQNLTPELKLTYSANLADSQDQIWTAEYNVRRRFLARYFRQTDQSNRMEFRQKFRFGGGPQTGDFSTRRQRRETRVGTITVTGTPKLDEKAIRKELKLKPGKKYEVLKSQDAVRRLRAFYAKQGYAEARIQQNRRYRRAAEDDESRPQDDALTREERRQRRQGNNDMPRVVDLEFTIDAGHMVHFIFEGADVGGKTRARIAQLWQQGLIDRQRLNVTTAELQRTLIREGYADANVTAEIKPADGDAQNVIYEIGRGVKFGRPTLVFPDLPKETAELLRDGLRAQKLDREVKSNPEAIKRFLDQYLRQEGYLSAKAGDPVVEVRDEDKLYVTIPVASGEGFVVGELKFEGVESVKPEDLLRALIIHPGDKYVPNDRFTFAQRIQEYYWNLGFRQAQVDVEEQSDLAAGRANLLFKVEENQRFEVAKVEIKGLSETSEAFVRRRLELGEGDLLAADKLNRSRRNMLDSGAYNLIDFAYPALGQPSIPSAPQPVAMEITVREPKPYRIDAGGTFDTERGPGVLFDISTVNTLGEARILGLRSLVDRKRQESRLYFTQPFLGSRRINTTATAYIRNEELEVYDNRLRGATIQQFIRFGPRFSLAYGYRYETGTTLAPDLNLLFTGATAPLTFALIRDDRDNALDASRGSFLSAAAEYGPKFLGGDFSYFRYYLQGFKYFGIRKPEIMPFEGGSRRSRWVFATAWRAGVANTLDGNQLFLPADRFFAGGGTTIRGYAQNSVGPQIAGLNIGGRATFIVNNELRFPLYKFLDGVGFVDAGNVWAQPSEFNVTDLRSSVGFGLRIRNPFVLIRLDYGMKLGRRPGESFGGFFFSIGQSF